METMGYCKLMYKIEAYKIVFTFHVSCICYYCQVGLIEGRRTFAYLFKNSQSAMALPCMAGRWSHRKIVDGTRKSLKTKTLSR